MLIEILIWAVLLGGCVSLLVWVVQLKADLRASEIERTATASKYEHLSGQFEVAIGPVLAATAEAPLTEAERQTLLEHLCMHCGGVHTQACPRVRRIKFRPDGQTPEEVEFWADDQWDASRVKWLEDLLPPSQPPTA